MTIVEKIEYTLRNSHGFVSIHELHKCTRNLRLIREVSNRLGYYEVFKPKSKRLLGVANYKYAHAWGGTNELFEY